MRYRNIFFVLVIITIAGFIGFGARTYEPKTSSSPVRATTDQADSTAAAVKQSSAIAPPSVGSSLIRTADPDTVISYARSHNLIIAKTTKLPDGQTLINIGQADTDPAVVALSNLPGTTAGPNLVYHALLTPNDPIYPQWYSDIINVPAAWDITTGSASVEVAVIDTGFSLKHEDLINRWDLTRGKDFVNNDNDPSTTVISHGTEVAGLIGAEANNGKGVAGVNWQSPLLPLQVLNDSGSGYTSDIVSALAYARSLGVKVANLSLGTTAADQLLKNEIDTDIAAGMTVVAAAGNCGSPSSYRLNGCSMVGQMLYPANFPEVIAVGATDSNDIRTSFSSYGPNLDLMAPGAGSLRSPTINGNNLTSAYSSNLFGTSYAAPIVSAAVALYKSAVPPASTSEIIAALQNSDDKPIGMNGLGFTNYYGFGRLNVFGLIKEGTLPHPDGTLIIDPTTKAVYLVQDSTKRYIPSAVVFLSYYNDVLSQSKTATQKDLNLPSGPDLTIRSGSVVKGSSPATYVVAQSGATLTKYYIPDPATYNSLGYLDSDRIIVDDNFLNSLPNGTDLSVSGRHPNGTLIRDADGITVYTLDNDQRRWVPNPYVLTSINKGKFSVRPATAGDAALPVGSNINYDEGALLKGSSPAIYVTDNQAGVTYKRHITSPYIYGLLGFSGSDFLNVPDGALPSLNGPDIN